MKKLLILGLTCFSFSVLPTPTWAQEEMESETLSSQEENILMQWSFLSTLASLTLGISQVHQSCLEPLDCPAGYLLELLEPQIKLSPLNRYFLQNLDFSSHQFQPDAKIQAGLNQINQTFRQDIVALKMKKYGPSTGATYLQFLDYHQKKVQQGQMRIRYSSIKANMHTLQTLVETYAVDHEGFYPASLKELMVAAQTSEYQYWKDFTNPLTNKTGIGGSLLDYSNYRAGDVSFQGQVLYQPILEDGEIKSYKIYGVDETGKLLQDKGEDFVLSNA